MSTAANQMVLEPRLPTYDEATGQSKHDPARLPSYKEARRARYHPYARFVRPVVDETERYLNTIYDEERVELDVPPARPGRRPTVIPLVPRPLVNEHLQREIERALAFERRVNRLQGVMLEFIAGVRRAARG